MENSKGLKGRAVDYKILKQMGFDTSIYSYLAKCTITEKDEIIVFPKVKVVELPDEKEIFYFVEGKEGIIIFTQEENPKMKIERLILN